MARYPSTVPGFVNQNGQIVVEATGRESASMAGQKIYRMRCEQCKYEYGANGCDIHERRCPKHQKGRTGETLNIRGDLSLFDSGSV